MTETPQINDKYQSKNGLIGTIKSINGVKMLEVKNSLGKISQCIVVRKLDLNKFERIS